MEQNKDKNKTKTLGKEENEGKKTQSNNPTHICIHLWSGNTLISFFSFFGGGWWIITNLHANPDHHFINQNCFV